jgi:hypothetical protein
MGGPDMAPHTPQTLGAPPGNPWRASIPPRRPYRCLQCGGRFYDRSSSAA